MYRIPNSNLGFTLNNNNNPQNWPNQSKSITLQLTQGYGQKWITGVLPQPHNRTTAEQQCHP